MLASLARTKGEIMNTGNGRHNSVGGSHTKHVFVGEILDGRMRTDVKKDENVGKKTASESHASLVALHKVQPNGTVEVLAFQVKQLNSPHSYPRWALPTESSESGETPLQTAVACVDTEIAAEEGALKVRIDPTPVFSKSVVADQGRTKEKKWVEELGVPEWVEIEMLFKLLKSRGRPFHRVALLKIMESLACRREVSNRYFSFLNQVPQLLQEEEGGPFVPNGGWESPP